MSQGQTRGVIDRIIKNSNDKYLTSEGKNNLMIFLKYSNVSKREILVAEGSSVIHIFIFNFLILNAKSL